MDIWSWVSKLSDELEEAGQERVASLFYRIVDLICNNDVHQAEALLPEALAAAKALENPWAEVFFRHQEMRLRLGLKGEGEAALPDVVDLLEFAHRRECADCPQTMCTTQDISSCYANIDGPGWAPERIAVSREGLAKIDPTWNCYSCLTLECVEALCDQGEPEEALEVFTEFQRKQREFGEEVYVFELHGRVSILIRLGRLDEALAALDEADKLPENETRVDLRMESTLLRAEILALAGRHAEAWEVLPQWGDLIPGDYHRWLHAVYLIASQDKERNSWGIGSVFQEGLDYMSKAGRHRSVINTGAEAARLALERGSVSTPRRILDLMKRHLPKLRRPLGADETLAALEAELDRLPKPELPVPAGELLDYIRDQDHADAEQGLDWLYTAMAERPDDADLLFTACSALAAVRAHDDARELLWSYIRRYPQDCESAVDELVRHTPHDQPEELERLAEFIQEHLPHMADWARLYQAYRADSLEDVARHARAFLDKRPDSRGGRMIWAAAAMNNQDFATAVRLRKEALALEERGEGGEANHYRWELLVAASCQGDWRTVRDTCVAMGFQVEPGDAPIEDAEGEYVRIRYLEDGEWRTAFARRTGPVTARVVSCSWPGQIQRLADHVVFDPAPLEDEPEDEEEKKFFYTPYRLVHVLEKGGKAAWLVDGAFPGEDAWSKFVDDMDARGYRVDVRSPDDYRVKDPAEAERAAADPDFAPAGLEGVYFLLGVPAALPPGELDALLAEACRDWAHPMCWYALAEAAGKPTEPHQAVIERYGL